MAYFLIANGTLYDPGNGIDGQPRDIWLRDGKVVAPPTIADPAINRRIDATGYVIMPGGVDLHCHIVGPKVNFGRQMTPEFRRDGQTLRRPGVRSATGGLIPSSWGTGYMFSGLGYTTAMDAAIPGLLARHAHEELQDTPLIDKGFYLLFGNNHFVMDRIREGRTEELDTYLGWSLEATKAFAVKIVNPGGVENWKQVCRKTIQQLEQPVPSFGVSPRQIVRQLASSVDRLGLPHALHIHCNNLGVPGNFETTLHTMQALEGHRGHFAHTQFHSYAGNPDDPASFRSAAPQLADYINDHPEISIDVGHVNPGQTLGMTGDAPFAHFLAQLSRNRWFAADCELESSCGIIPMEFHPRKVLIHAVQWAAALEWYLLVKNPWQLAMSSDHPNGGAIFRYPEIIHLLMDNAFRQEALARMHPVLGERSRLAELTREYTLGEIAIITRAAPARILGLTSKGHLGVGADADLTIYTPNPDIREMFSRPRYVIQNGALVCEDGQILADTPGRTFTTAAPYDASGLAPIRSWFNDHHTIRFGNFAIAPNGLAGLETVSGSA